MDIETYALCKKLIAQSGNVITDAQASRALESYLEANPGTIISEDKLNDILADYLKTSNLDLSSKQDKLNAGNNITFSDDGKTISAVDTKYTVTIEK